MLKLIYDFNLVMLKENCELKEQEWYLVNIKLFKEKKIFSAWNIDMW